MSSPVCDPGSPRGMSSSNMSSTPSKPMPSEQSLSQPNLSPETLPYRPSSQPTNSQATSIPPTHLQSTSSPESLFQPKFSLPKRPRSPSASTQPTSVQPASQRSAFQQPVPTTICGPYIPQDSADAFDRLRCALLNVLSRKNLSTIKHSRQPLFQESNPGKLSCLISFDATDPIEAALFRQVGLKTIDAKLLLFRISTRKIPESSRTVYRINADAIAYDKDMKIIKAQGEDGKAWEVTSRISFTWWVARKWEQKDISPSLVWKEVVGILQHWIEIGYGVDGHLLEFSEVSEWAANPNPLLHLGFRGWPGIGSDFGPGFRRM